MATDKAQRGQIKDLACRIEMDDDDGRWKDRLCQIAKQQPMDAPEKPE